MFGRWGSGRSLISNSRKNLARELDWRFLSLLVKIGKTELQLSFFYFPPLSGLITISFSSIVFSHCIPSNHFLLEIHHNIKPFLISKPKRFFFPKIFSSFNLSNIYSTFAPSNKLTSQRKSLDRPPHFSSVTQLRTCG
jgi:hypothetical protein